MSAVMPCVAQKSSVAVGRVPAVAVGGAGFPASHEQAGALHGGSEVPEARGDTRSQAGPGAANRRRCDRVPLIPPLESMLTEAERRSLLAVRLTRQVGFLVAERRRTASALDLGARGGGRRDYVVDWWPARSASVRNVRARWAGS